MVVMEEETESRAAAVVEDIGINTVLARRMEVAG